MPRSSTGTNLQGKPQNAPLVTIFPDAKNNKSKAAAAPKSILKNRHEDVVDDIEFPAGRLWIEQQDDFDDSISLGSLSLPGAATLLEDYHAAARKRHAARLKMNLEEEQREQLAFEEYQKKLLEEEGKSLYFYVSFLILHFFLDLRAWRCCDKCGYFSPNTFLQLNITAEKL